MLLKQETLAGIAEGRITLAFRRWKRPTVKAGGTLLTSIGQLAVERVDPVDAAEITDRDARAAGFERREDLLHVLNRRPEGVIYRVGLRLAGPDPRIALRHAIPGPEEIDEIRTRLDRWDRASPIGPWTLQALELIAEHPGRRAGDLAEASGVDKARLKTDVRKLKGLGLTDSLKVGYRLSPRGAAVLDHLRGAGG